MIINEVDRASTSSIVASLDYFNRGVKPTLLINPKKGVRRAPGLGICSKGIIPIVGILKFTC